MAQIDNMKILLGITDTTQDALLQLNLDMAGEFIADRRDTYNIDTGEPEVERKYNGIQVELAIEGYSKMGAEGEESHSEAGIRRAYENGGLYSQSTVNQIIPKAKVIVIETVE